MPVSWTFGKVTVSTGWVSIKILMISLMITFLFTPFIWIAIPVLIYYGYLIVHEFIHAAAVRKYGGILDKIFLGYPLSYIDFQMPSAESEKAVYGWGAFADFIIMLMISFSLFQGSAITQNGILFWLGILFIVIFAATELLPEHSDLQEYSRKYK